MARKRSRKKQEVVQGREKVTVAFDEVLNFSDELFTFISERKPPITVAIASMQVLQEFFIADFKIPQHEIDQVKDKIKSMTKGVIDSSWIN